MPGFASRRYFLQFRLKALMIVMLVVAVLCGLAKWKMARKQRERAAVADIQAENQKRCQEPFLSFGVRVLGRPRERIVDPRPRRRIVRCFHDSLP